jgi:hypothetical protein
MMVEIFPTSLVVQPGHRLRLALTTGDLPHQGPNLSTLADSVGGTTTVYFGGTHASRVYLGSDTARPARVVNQSSEVADLQGVPKLGAGLSSPNTSPDRPGAAASALALVALTGGLVAIARRRRAARPPD